MVTGVIKNKIIFHITLIITMLLLTGCNQKVSNSGSTVSKNNAPYEKLSELQRQGKL